MLPVEATMVNSWRALERLVGYGYRKLGALSSDNNPCICRGLFGTYHAKLESRVSNVHPLAADDEGAKLTTTVRCRKNYSIYGTILNPTWRRQGG